MAAAEKSMMPPWSWEFSLPESSSPDPRSSCSRSAEAELPLDATSERASISNNHKSAIRPRSKVMKKLVARGHNCYAAKDHLLSGMSWAAPQLARRVSKSWAGCACCHAPQSWSSGDPRATEAPGVGEGPWSPRCTHPTTSGQRPTEGWRRQEKSRYIFKWHIKPRRQSRNIIETHFIYTLPTSGNICHYPDLTKHCLWI